MNTLPDGKIDQLIQRNVCARYYGELTKRPADQRQWEFYCPACGDAWHGATIRRSTAEGRGQKALSELYEVKANVPDLFPNPHKGRSAQSIISDLY
jgi:predicted RNA-binding Zn-ribbon protein involved in translation (DUF1610 family)